MSAINTRDLQAGLRRSRHKLTRPRRAVLEVIAEAEEHLTPAEVHCRAQRKHPQLGLTTVYRTLDLLVELGCVRRVHDGNGCNSYVAAGRPHGHSLLCSCCGQTQEFTDCDLGTLVATLQERTGYEIDDHILQLIGRCPACRAREGAGHRAPQKDNDEA